jgi:drug/metabolite transporter (DMT)-like permease
MLALLGFIGVALHQWLQANGLTTAAATTTAWLVATTPIFIALLGWMALRERLTWVQWCGIGVGALGVLTILSRGNFASLLVSAPSDPGDILVLLSAPNWAVYTILSRRVLSEISPSKMIFYVMLVGWLFITLWTFGFGPGLSQVGALTWRGWIAVGGLGIFGSGLAYIMYHDALRVLPAPQLGVFLNLEPLVTLLLAAPVLGEPLNFIVLLGGWLIVAGIYLVNRRRSGSQAGEVVGSVEIEDKQ